MTASDCCASQPSPTPNASCPTCGTAGKAVKLVTLKALLTPDALATLDPEQGYRFCPDAACDVVYFSPGRVYGQGDIKVPVFQKDQQETTPVCYCFGHSRAHLQQAAREEQADAIPSSIQAHIKARRCGCELNNPQGTCCLGNVNRLVTALKEVGHA